MTHKEILAMIPEGYQASISDGILHIQAPEYIGIVLKKTTEVRETEFDVTIRTNGTASITMWKNGIGTHTIIF